ncbi:MAG: phosphoesterase, partial [Bacteroidota bacterium]
FDEFESIVKKAVGKTTIIAMYHPLFSHGEYGGQYSFVSHLKPLPVLGTLKNVVRKTGGLSTSDIQNKRYRELKDRLSTLAQENNKVIFVSSHEKSLQYTVQDNIHQIISGAVSETQKVRLTNDGVFAYANQGYATIDVFNDGSSRVKFSPLSEDDTYFETELFKSDIKKEAIQTATDFPKEVSASIYSIEETQKTGFHKFLWGDRYRDEYSKAVKAPTVRLDTLFGGLTPIRRGGGNQSKSLRLEDKNGAQYVMRALRKNGVKYLQAVMFKDQYIKGQFEETETESLILDAFTGAHPYAPFVIGDLANAIGVYHTNPVLYFVPKQKALDHYNDDYGNELYMIEEHTSEGHSDKASFGYRDRLISTDEMLAKTNKDEDIRVDEVSYIKSRLFDMLIGDWDRHDDQWRWIEFEEANKKVYRPMPRDRDQAFSIMDDGFLLGAATTLIPTIRMLRSYSDDLKDVKGVNIEPFPLDLAIIQESNKSVWDEQVQLIQKNMTNQVIEKAFLNFPPELNADYIAEIKSKLISRRENLQEISNRYYELINKHCIVRGTNKDDWFDIERLENGNTKITAFRIKENIKADIFHQRVYDHNDTKEIWIYGLGDEDVFNVTGTSKAKIKVRLIGGKNKDTYDVQNGSRLKLYDYKTKKNVLKTNKGLKNLTDDYETNVYDYKKPKANTNQIIPTISSNPDDGFKIGVMETYTHYGFERNPFTSQHNISAAYYFATEGYEINYTGEFANVIGRGNLEVNINYNSPNYAINFFGYGNSTPNPETDEDDNIDVDFDYNRVKIRTFKLKPSIVWRGDLGSIFKLSALYESNEVERTDGRFLDDAIDLNNQLNSLAVDETIFDNQDFWGGEMEYHFKNKDHTAFPTLGMQFSLQAGFRNNLDTSKGFAYVIPELGFDYRLIPSGNLVLATDVRAHVNFGDDFEFYQAATLGANTGLRGYRNERFTGKSKFVQSTDLRWNFSDLRTNVLPIHLGVYGGFDYGRVWVDDALVFDNDYNSNTLNTSYGGGFFINISDILSFNISAFNSDDDLRIAFKMGFDF